MTGEEHYRQSQRLLRLAQKTSEEVANLTVADHKGVAALMDTLLLQAQVHATLALTAATARHFAKPGEFGKADFDEED